jgi:hypothetical protein
MARNGTTLGEQGKQHTMEKKKGINLESVSPAPPLPSLGERRERERERNPKDLFFG